MFCPCRFRRWHLPLAMPHLQGGRPQPWPTCSHTPHVAARSAAARCAVLGKTTVVAAGPYQDRTRGDGGHRGLANPTRGPHVATSQYLAMRRDQIAPGARPRNVSRQERVAVGALAPGRWRCPPGLVDLRGSAISPPRTSIADPSVNARERAGRTRVANWVDVGFNATGGAMELAPPTRMESGATWHSTPSTCAHRILMPKWARRHGR